MSILPDYDPEAVLKRIREDDRTHCFACGHELPTVQQKFMADAAKDGPAAGGDDPT